MGDGGFLDPKQPKFHCLLSGSIVVCAFAFDEKSILTQPLKQSVLTDFNTVTFEDFCQFADKDGTNRVGGK
jgi:hypothetical protein